MEVWLEFDEVEESEVPAFAQDGKSGDWVSFIEGGVLVVRSGRASFARWSDVLGVVEHQGKLHVLVPRRPPAQPWLVVDRDMVGGDIPALRRVAERLREGGGAGGYREAVKAHRKGMSTEALQAKVSAREPVGGAMEVPSTVVLGRSYPGLGLAQATLVIGSGVLGFGLAFGMMFAIAVQNPRAIDTPGVGTLVQFFGIACLAVGALLARALGKRWRAKKDATLPRQRVLVLAPDGCIVGFTEGVRTLSWAQVGSFGLEPVEPDYDDGLVVYGPEGKRFGHINTAFLDAPPGLVVAVANTYREAATG